MKRHFSSNFDFFSNKGTTRVSREAYDKRRDKAQFEQLAKHPDWERFLLANMLNDHNQWIGTFLSENGEEVYRDWCQRIDTMTYTFKQDIGKLHGTFNRNFTANRGDHPYLLSLYLSRNVSLETMVILDQLLGYRERWDKDIKEKYVWPAVSLKIKKYTPFLSVDKKKYKKIALDIINQSDINTDIEDIM